MNAAVRQAQYAVRGELVIRAEEIRKKLERGESMPFKKLIMCNIGNPQSLKQKPLTFVRQVRRKHNHPLSPVMVIWLLFTGAFAVRVSRSARQA